jgi:tRNA (guanine-N7-)-methyltransferase
VAKKKLIRFEENKTFPNLFQYNFLRLEEEGFPLKGNWHRDFFKNENPIVVELGCGKGEYSFGLAKTNPDKNYIGIDFKGARLWAGCTNALNENLGNVAFIEMCV